MPVRVAYLIDRLRRAGTEAQLLTLIRCLDRGRVEPHLILLDGSDDESRSLEPVDCPVLRLGVHSFHHPSTPLRAFRLARYLKAQQIDVLQAYFLDSVYFGVPLARLAGVRAVVRVRNNLGYWLTRWHSRLGRWYGRWVDYTLTNSDAGRDALRDSEGLSPERIVVLENGVDVDRFVHLPPPLANERRLQIGALANLRPVKRLDLLLRAAARLAPQHPGLHIAIAGDGPLRSELEALAAALGVTARVTFHGAIDAAPAFIAKLDVAVLCSDSEGMSNALLEYMAGGRAIVATRTGANPRLIREGIDGLLVSPGSADELAAALARLIADPAWARQLAQSARHRAVNAFSRAAAIRRFEDFYERLAALGYGPRRVAA